MSYDNRFTGAITITPPLTRTQIRAVQDGATPRITDVRLQITESETVADDGESVIMRWSADAIVPLDMTYSGHNIAEDIQALIDHFKDHEFAGYIQVQWDPGFEDPTPARYVVQDRRVLEVRPTLVWPNEAPQQRQPARMDPDTLAAVLADMSARVAVGDSFDGTITYEFDIEGEGPEFLVTATYRVGNRMGQGGMRMIQGGEG